MLVLTGSEYDSITISDDVEITVLAVKGKTVKIGIVAPRDLDVLRSEVYVRLCRISATQSEAEGTDTA